MSQTQVALITGSGKQRVGSRVANVLAKKGFAVALHYFTSGGEAIRSAEHLKQQGADAIAMQADLRDESSARSLFAEVLARWGRLDVLVTCASIWQPKRLEDVTAQDVRAHFEANTLSTFLSCQQAGLIMTRQTDGGCIITMGDWAVQRPYLHYAAYFASKGAIPTLTRCFAVELGSRNPRVRVNCIQPGPVLLRDDIPNEEKESIIQSTLVRREGSPDHIARAVLYLVENDFVTGDCITVDGGRTVFARGD
jgi:pteridine reductase